VGKFLKKRAALALYVVIRSHFLSFIYSNEIKNENTNYKFSVFFPSIPHHQCCHIPKSLSSLGRKREKAWCISMVGELMVGIGYLE
jgi:hypothetical protein